MSDPVPELVPVRSCSEDAAPAAEGTRARGRTASVPTPERVSRTARELRVVLVSLLEDRLAKQSEVDVLTALADGDTLTTTVRTSDVCCALVSYRQEAKPGATRAAGQHPYAALTLDGAALRGIVSAARSLKVDALWLDAWCYRSCGEYDHEDFCQTLNDVIEGVEAVIWLPRSKRDSSAEYAYRPRRESNRATPGSRARLMTRSNRAARPLVYV